MQVKDKTTDPVWLDQQIDRLLGFEVLHKAITGDPHQMSPADLGDKIGVHKGYSHCILKNIKRRYKK